MIDDLRRRRLRLGLTQKQLGVSLGVSGNTIHRWETGLVRMPRTAALLLERIEADAAGAGSPTGALPGRPIAQVVVPVIGLSTRLGAEGEILVPIVLQISAAAPLDDAIREQPPDPSGEDQPENAPGGDRDDADA